MSHNKPSRLRFAINLGNAVLAHLGETGKPAGITVELSHRLATRWGVSAEFVPYPAAGKVVADAGGEHWDIAFLAIDPAREATLRFTSPYITGRFVVLNFDDRGTVTHRAILGETCTVLEMAAGTWHAVLSLDT
ncbi:transporter substrate-binding domain-containing protein, partial [Klebsiella pneumoniae]|uniref:transporter substrate-binding domain-containing protein n=1 Tax=Klebsiella pneumoniae TaxID=573 RepID=UPI0021A4DCA6